MEVDLLKYMSERLTDDSDQPEEAGPVITISRLYGCPAKKVARKLISELSLKLAAKGIKQPDCVITSYSIHYTKLYDNRQQPQLFRQSLHR